MQGHQNKNYTVCLPAVNKDGSLQIPIPLSKLALTMK
jgi:hypothetical protein